ncbi:hypothetical protein DRE_01178 [Drechslerella stenobrocha 248]|uniref:Uncharacterized protein n=1 Tax=Drechslerella stenobrocha 248 TaxID=1043628 RepID=W7HWA0_9PEZI|nr:hypothetical protein DRE_01178 [Drechslerella stenobrocha 248]
MAPPKVFFTGLPYNHHTLPGWGWPPERVQSGLITAVEVLMQEGYDAIGYFIAPEQGIKVFEDKLGEEKWDAVIIGWGVRGNKDLTHWMEDMVNCIREKAPNTKILFNWDPESTIDTVRRNIPILEESDKTEMRAVFAKFGVEGRVVFNEYEKRE